MPPICIIVVAELPDLQAEGIIAAVEAGSNGSLMLLGGGVVEPGRVDALLNALPLRTPCAVIAVQSANDSGDHFAEVAADWLDASAQLVLLKVTVGDDRLEIIARDVSMDALLSAVRGLLDPTGLAMIEYLPVSGAQPPPGDQLSVRSGALSSSDRAKPLEQPEPAAILLNAAVDWVHVVLRTAVERLVETPSEGSGSVSNAGYADLLEGRPPRTSLFAGNIDLIEASDILEDVLVAADDSEPLARLLRTLTLDPIETRLFLLALAPQLDPRYQRWISLLQDDPGRRVGTLGLFSELLGSSSEIAGQLAVGGRLTQWRLFDTPSGRLPAADEPLRVDPPLWRWLLGAEQGLADDPALSGLLRSASWRGAWLGDLGNEFERSEQLIARLKPGLPPWLLLSGDTSASWRALLEIGAARCSVDLIRCDLSRIADLGCAEIDEAGVRLARLALISGRLLALDASDLNSERTVDDALRRFFVAVDSGRHHTAIIAPQPARIAAALGNANYKIERNVTRTTERIAALQSAARGANAHFTEEAAESLVNLFPLQIDGLEQAMQIARAEHSTGSSEDESRARFVTACKEVSAEGASGLAQRLEPSVSLDDLVLPPDRKSQLGEIINNIRFAPIVLESWKFRDQLPYGLGVTALFHGPSGTGKTMAALAVAHSLGVQVVRIDLSRLVSKYIGDTEKNIDRVFLEAQYSGAALLIDEADSLMSRRSEVKDAHDRYANIEVAYLLQRMESHEGLAIMTTNLRQNLDPAFLRRLRFIVDFPRPDVAAREAIWRKCLPEDAHLLDNATFRQLSRKIDLTGGSIRQITLRAAFIAAAAMTRISAEHVAQACRAEYAKLGVPPVELDLRGELRAA